MKRRLLATAAVVGMCLLAACSAQPTGSDTGSPGQTQTAPDPGRGTAPMSKRTAEMMSCMEDQGVPVEYDGRGGLSTPEGTVEETALWSQLMSECGETAGWDKPWTVDELKQLYRLEVENHRCLLDAGYESGEPPSEQAYIDAWMQGTEPYQSVAEVGSKPGQAEGGSLFFEATQLCPAPLWSFG